MTHFRKEFRVPRWKALRLLLTRRGLVMRLDVETDGDFIAAMVTDPAPAPKRVWPDQRESS